MNTGPRRAAHPTGYDLITAILDAGGHVVARVKEKTGSRSAPPSTTPSCPAATARKSPRPAPSSQPPGPPGRTRGSGAGGVHAALHSEAAAGPRPAPEGQCPGHRGRGILHRRPSPLDPLDDIFPGHGLVVIGRARRRGGRCGTRRPAHPQRPGRQRHSQRAQKARPKFAHASATKQTITGKPQVTVFAPGYS